MDDDIPTMEIPDNELESAAVQRFLLRQAAGRAVKEQKNTELRPSTHRYSSPAKAGGGSFAVKNTGYTARYKPTRNVAGWNASTTTAQSRPKTLPRRFEKDIAAKYRENAEFRRQVTLESVRIDDDFRPEITRLLNGFKARCRNRSRDMTVHNLWRKIERDAPVPSEEEAAAADAAAKAAEEADVAGVGSGKWIHRQRVARLEKQRVEKQKRLRAPLARTATNGRPAWNASTLLERRIDGELQTGYEPDEAGHAHVSLDTLRHFQFVNESVESDNVLASIQQR
mmetsp:Transcript_29635/g.43926  ORF Transcript_29635/g.43926 Transcript_29635/m.43926 type:complete len:283 (+) Transcript_29635:106-954(+)